MCHRVLCMRAGFSQLPVCSLENKCCLLDTLNFVILQHERDRGTLPCGGSAGEEHWELCWQHSPSSSHKQFLHFLQGFASQLEADPTAGRKQPVQDSLQDITVPGEVWEKQPRLSPCSQTLVFQAGISKLDSVFGVNSGIFCCQYFCSQDTCCQTVLIYGLVRNV